MIKEITKIVLESNLIYLWLDKKKLNILYEDKIHTICYDVKKYSVYYSDGDLYICVINTSNHMIIIRNNLAFLNFEESNIFELKVELELDCEEFIFYVTKSMVKILTTKKLNDGLYECEHITVDRNGNILDKSIVDQSIKIKEYEKALTLVRANNNVVGLILVDSTKGLYLIVDMYSGEVFQKVHLGNCTNISTIVYKNNMKLIYNLINEKEIKLRYRDINISNLRIIIGKEEELGLKGYITKPLFYQNSKYINIQWINNDYLYSGKSEDLSKWDIERKKLNSKIKLVKSKTMKISGELFFEDYSYINSEIVESNKLDTAQSIVKKNTKLVDIEEKFKSDNTNYKYKNQFTSIRELIQLEKEYSDRCSKYLRQINELNELLNEKDKMIFELLELR